MQSILLVVVPAMTCLQAQTVKDLLLPQTRHIVGVVTDSEGKPVAAASIDYTNDRHRAYATDPDGRFELETRAPILVVRKAGFRSEAVRVQDATEVRVTLQRLSKNQYLPTCSNTGEYEGLEGWETRFQFPRSLGVKVSIQGHAVDYSTRDYYVDTKQGRKGIRHGSGPMWGVGVPLDHDVWRSVKFEEVVYEMEGLFIIDARGQLSDGNRWRSLGKFGETASYSDVDAETAKILDHFLDGACLKRQ